MNFWLGNMLVIFKKNYIIKIAENGKDFENLLKKIKENGYYGSNGD